MKFTFLNLALSFVVLMVPSAVAQCPSDQTTVLAGRWTFAVGNIAAGQFTATQGSTNLSVIATVAVSGPSLVTTDNGTAHYVLNSTCTGGTMYFTMQFLPVIWDFDLSTADPTYARLITFRPAAIVSLPPYPVPPPANGIFLPAPIGNAWPAPAPGCPANPLNMLNGVYTRASLVGVGARLEVGPPRGAFWNPIGTVSVFAPVPTPPSTITPTLPPDWAPFIPPSAEPFPGAYFFNSDCTRGYLNLYNPSPRPLQYEFYPRVTRTAAVEFVMLGIGSNLSGITVTSGSVRR